MDRHVEEPFTWSALNSGNRYGREASIDRSFHKSGYFLHEAQKAATRADGQTAGQIAKQALALHHWPSEKS